jgi:hypothetical protein
MTGFVYAIQAGDAVKIGWAADPVRRLSELNVGSPGTHKLLGFIAATKDQERELHSLLSVWRIRGEWFSISKVIAHFIELLPRFKIAPHAVRNHVPRCIKFEPQIKALAVSLGATGSNISKWESRGIPAKWELKLLEALGRSPRLRTNEPSHRIGRPPSQEAAE